MKYVKNYKIYNESISNFWEEGFKNTKTFVFYTDNDKMYLSGCKTCNEVTPLTNMFKERQMIGNVYQSLCNCSVCGNYVVLDEHKLDSLNFYLSNKEKIDTNTKNKIRHGLHVNIFSNKINSSREPIEIINCEPFEYKDIYGNLKVDTLYVYAVESHTDDLMDNPMNNSYQNERVSFHIIIDLDKKQLHYPYPISEIDRKFPKAVADIFKQYVEKYTK